MNVGIVPVFSGKTWFGGEIAFLEKLGDKTILEHTLSRLKLSKTLDKIILVTSFENKNETYIEIAQKCGVEAFCSDKIATSLKAMEAISNFKEDDNIIVLSGGIPLIDIDMIDNAVRKHEEKEVEFTILHISQIYIYKVGIYREVTIALLKNIQYRNIDPANFYNIYDYNLVGVDEIYKIGNFIYSNQEKFKICKIDCEPKKGKIFNVRATKANKILKELFKIKLSQPESIVDYQDALDDFDRSPQRIWSLYGIGNLKIELTNDCNLKCIMCPRKKMTREIGYMEPSVFCKIIDQYQSLKSLNFFGVDFSLFGEPLMHPEFLNLLRYAKDKLSTPEGKLPGFLYTNGVNLDEQRAQVILESNLEGVIFSLDAATPETYQKIKGVDVYNQVVGNINKFLQLKKEFGKDRPKEYGKQGPIVGLQITKMKETDTEIEEFMNKWDWMDKIKKMINYRNRSQELSKIEDDQEKLQASQKLKKELWETFYTKAELPVEHAIIGHFNRYCNQIEDRSVIDVTPLKRFACRQLEGLAIFWNGDVTICEQDFNGNQVIGNIKENSLMEVKNSQRLIDLTLCHWRGEYIKNPLCEKCKEWYIPIS